MDYEIQYARLVTTEKLPDRFLNTQLRANADLSKTHMGEVFVLVEILSPCPVYQNASPVDSLKFVKIHMASYYPVKAFRVNGEITDD